MASLVSNDVENASSYELVGVPNLASSSENLSKSASGISWFDVCFKVKSKNILNNCWGNVSVLYLMNSNLALLNSSFLRCPQEVCAL